MTAFWGFFLLLDLIIWVFVFTVFIFIFESLSWVILKCIIMCKYWRLAQLRYVGPTSTCHKEVKPIQTHSTGRVLDIYSVAMKVSLGFFIVLCFTDSIVGNTHRVGSRNTTYTPYDSSDHISWPPSRVILHFYTLAASEWMTPLLPCYTRPYTTVA